MEKTSFELPKDIDIETGNDLLLHLDMYQVSGQDTITPESLSRYAKDRDQLPEIEQAQEITKQPSVEEIIYKEILYAPLPERANIIRTGLSSGDAKSQLAYVKSIHLAPEDVKNDLYSLLPEIIQKGFDTASYEDQEVFVNMLEYSPNDARADLIRSGLNADNPNVQRMSASKIHFAPSEKRSGLIEFGFSVGHTEAQLRCSMRINFCSPQERANLIRLGLNSNNPYLQKDCAEQILYLLRDEKIELKKVILPIVQEGLKNNDPNALMAYTDMIAYVPDEEQNDLYKQALAIIQKGLESNDPNIQRASAAMIYNIPTDQRKSFVEENLDKYGEIFIEAPLYHNHDLSSEGRTIQRSDLGTLNSDITVLGGDLRGKALIRQIKPLDFLAWQKAFEDYKTWEKAGFDYVPVEPIISFYFNNGENKVETASTVLDITFKFWRAISNRFVDELKNDVKKITSVCEKSKISHNDIHNGNICLRFYRDENGKPDFNRKPRLYLIDFGEASISNPNN